MSRSKAVVLPAACGNWLAQNGCLIPKQIEKKGANVALGPDNVRLLLSGIAFGRAIQKALGANKTLDGLRLNNNDGNWNTLVPILRRLAVKVENDSKSLILSGDAAVAWRQKSKVYIEGRKTAPNWKKIMKTTKPCKTRKGKGGGEGMTRKEGVDKVFT